MPGPTGLNRPWSAALRTADAVGQLGIATDQMSTSRRLKAPTAGPRKTKVTRLISVSPRR